VADWKQALRDEWNRRHAGEEPRDFFPLVSQSFDDREIVASVDALLNGRLTMDHQVRSFEQRFAAYIGAPYAVMVNSGSSANLLALSAASNPARRKRLMPGDEVVIPAVCWATSLWPIVQMGLKPVFVDVSPATLNMDVSDLRRKITPKTRAVMLVHVLGNAASMADVLALAKEQDLLLIEDTCESLGSRYKRQFLGTLGDFGCFSFYYSHHITTGEGGMVVCRSLEDCDLLKCLRAHGWSRELSNREHIERANEDIDPRFLFVNCGYNVRPLEVQAAFGHCQLDRLADMNDTRNTNRTRIIAALQAHPKWQGQLEFPVATENIAPTWFGLAALLGPRFARHRSRYVNQLSTRGVENRPIIGGNFTRQPAATLFGIAGDPSGFPGAEEISRRGFFVGLHTESLSDEKVDRLASILLDYDFA
jgi:CDP-6-deoxy-D-xylo-4-hexulose-3-dehydrase